MFKSALKLSGLLLILILCQEGLLAQDKTRVLFVGNSYTYFWNLPQTVEALITSSGEMEVELRQSTAGGLRLKDHWECNKGLKSRELIAEGNWDLIIIQNHSLSSLQNPDEFMEYGRRFIELAKESGATPVLYMTWHRKFNPLMQQTITRAYQNLATETGISLAPVGEAWSKSVELRPDLELYAEDMSHPSPAGTYLAACVFYNIITGEDPMDLPHRVKTTDKNGEVLYLSIMDEGNADFIQQVVWETMNERKW